MPYTLKPNKFYVKDPENAGFLPQNVVTEESTAQQLQSIQQAGETQVGNVNTAGTTQIGAINARATEVQASLPKSGEMEDMVAVPFTQADAYPAGKFVIQTVNSVNGLYRLPEGHTAGTTWANTTKEGPLQIADEVSGLKSAIQQTVTIPTLRNGSSSNPYNDKQVATAQIIPFGDETKIKISVRKAPSASGNYFRLLITTFSVSSGKPEDNSGNRIVIDEVHDTSELYISKGDYSSSTKGFSVAIAEKNSSDVTQTLRIADFGTDDFVIIRDYVDIAPINASIQAVHNEATATQNQTDGIQSDLTHLEDSTTTRKTAGANNQTVVEITDALEGKIKETITLAPVQDLHGYEKPWVGGAGKNLIDQSQFGDATGITLDANGYYAGARSSFSAAFSNGLSGEPTYAANTQYTLSFTGYCSGSTSYTAVGFKYTDSTEDRIQVANTTAALKTLTSASGKTIDHLLITYGSEGSITFYIKDFQLEVGTTATNYIPYSNICPITGYDSVGVTRCGKNLFNAATCENKSVHSSGYISTASNRLLSWFIPVKENESYMVSFPTGIQFNGHIEYDANNTYLRRVLVDRQVATVITPQSPVVRLYFAKANTSADISVSDIAGSQMEYGTTATAYEPYVAPASMTIPVKTLNSGNTVYGGTVTVNRDGSGTLVVDRAIKTLNGTETWAAYNDQGCYMTLNDMVKKAGTYKTDNAIVCDKLPVFNTSYAHDFWSAEYAITGWANTTNPGSNYIYAKTGAATYSDATPLKNWLAANPTTIAYALAAPVSIPLTATQITTLLGYNYLTTDGSGLVVEYAGDKYAGDIADLNNQTDGIQSDLTHLEDSTTTRKTAGANNQTVVEITDALEGKLKETITLNPKQDLHGYDSPWPGGAGKNKAAFDQYDSTLSDVHVVYSGGTVTLSGTASSLRDFNTSFSFNNSGKTLDLGPGTYVFSIDKYENINESGNILYLTIKNTNTGVIRYVGVGSTLVKTETVAANEVISSMFIRVASGTTLNNVVIKPFLALASESDGTWEPYSNICPITGYDSVGVTRCGKNLIDPSVFTSNGGVLQSDGSYYVANQNSLYNKVAWENPGHEGQVTITWIHKDADSATATGSYPIIYYTDGTSQTNFPGVSVSPNAWQTVSYTTPSGKMVDKVSFTYASNAAGYYKIQIELGPTATTYTPYSGATLTIPVKTLNSGNTVYGGTVTVNRDGSGTLVVDRAMAQITDISAFDTDLSGKKVKRYTFVETLRYDMYTVNIIAENLPATTYNARGAAWSIYNASPTQINVVADTDTTVAEYNSKLSGSKMVARLATPVTIPLTAAQITTLLGYNYLTTDGSGLVVEYAGDKYQIAPAGMPSPFDLMVSMLNPVEYWEEGGTVTAGGLTIVRNGAVTTISGTASANVYVHLNGYTAEAATGNWPDTWQTNGHRMPDGGRRDGASIAWCQSQAVNGVDIGMLDGVMDTWAGTSQHDAIPVAGGKAIEVGCYIGARDIGNEGQAFVIYVANGTVIPAGYSITAQIVGGVNRET